MTTSPARWRRFTAALGAPADVKAYWRYALRHPLDAAPRRPSLVKRRPAYLDGLSSHAVLRSWPLDRNGVAIAGGAWPDQSGNIRLASVDLPTESPLHIDWEQRFDDLEDLSALHRFAWLMPWVVQASAAGSSRMALWSQIVTSAQTWRRYHPQPSSHEAWHPYAVSERLVNWFWAGVVTGRALDTDAELSRSIEVQADHLEQNVEYYGEAFTGNHLSNNGRALYLTGVARGDARTAAVGRTILINEAARLLDGDGFLREGSSHYQLLVTRNYCEALRVAIGCGDAEAVQQLTPTVERLAAASAFFVVQTGDGRADIPRIGDLSPDCPPRWLIGVPWVAASLVGKTLPPPRPASTGWDAWFPSRTAGTSTVERAQATAIVRPRRNPEWARLDHANAWTVFAHVNPRGFPGLPGHAHQDTGAFVAYHAGEPIVLDAGRRRYTPDPESEWGRRAPGHSILTVDGLGPAPEWHWLFSPKYLEKRAGACPTLSATDRDITIEHGGFARITGVGLYTRTITPLDSRTLRITDHVAGSGTHRIDLRFHLASRPSIDINPPAGLSRETISAPGGARTDGWGSAEYGHAYPLTTVIAFGDVTLPWIGVTTLTVPS